MVEAAHIEVTLLGLASAHGPEFVVDRPRGLGSYLLMCFHTPFRCDTVTGRVEGRAGDCVLHDPKFPQWHAPSEGGMRGFCNDWIHFSGKSVPALAASFGIPFNRVLPTGHPHAISDRLKSIELEIFHKHPFWREAVGIEIRAALLRVARLARLAEYEGGLGQAERDHIEKFRAIRLRLHEEYSTRWSASDMARLARVSVNRFNTLYRKFFRVSPIEDLICIRIEKAKALLMEGGGSVGEVAERCGFSSIYYFSRVFRNRTGLSPRAFRAATG